MKKDILPIELYPMSKPLTMKTDTVYILNLRDNAQLKNGFVYIKELLLQYHNFRMYSDYQALTKSYCKGRRDIIQEI